MSGPVGPARPPHLAPNIRQASSARPPHMAWHPHSHPHSHPRPYPHPHLHPPHPPHPPLPPSLADFGLKVCYVREVFLSKRLRMNNTLVFQALTMENVQWDDPNRKTCSGGSSCFCHRNKSWWPCVTCGYRPENKYVHPTVGDERTAKCPACFLIADPSCTGAMCKDLRNRIRGAGVQVREPPAPPPPPPVWTQPPAALPSSLSASAAAWIPSTTSAAPAPDFVLLQQNWERVELTLNQRIGLLETVFHSYADEARLEACGGCGPTAFCVLRSSRCDLFWVVVLGSAVCVLRLRPHCVLRSAFTRNAVFAPLGPR